jgi:hypothetical protein
VVSLQKVYKSCSRSLRFVRIRVHIRKPTCDSLN